MTDFAWRSTGEYQTASNIRRFMNRHDIADHSALLARANGDIAWFWKAALEDLGAQRGLRLSDTPPYGCSVKYES